MSDPVAKAQIWMDAKWHKILKWVNGIVGTVMAINWGVAQANLPNLANFIPAHYYHLLGITVAVGTFATMTLKGKTA